MSDIEVVVTEGPDAVVTVEEEPDTTVTVALSPPVEAIEVGVPGPAGPQGEQGPVGSDLNYLHTQALASTLWEVAHGLGKYPSVTVKDTSERIVFGSVTYIDIDNLTIEFSVAFSGAATCN